MTRLSMFRLCSSSWPKSHARADYPSYAEGISRNHAFVDGNKRTAFYVASDFLEQNGYELQAAKGHEHAEMMEQLGQGKISREEVAAHLREHSNILKMGSS